MIYLKFSCFTVEAYSFNLESEWNERLDQDCLYNFRTKWKRGSEGVLYVLKFCTSLGLIATTIPATSRTRKTVCVRTGLRGHRGEIKGEPSQ
jgi:hypothetical protein